MLIVQILTLVLKIAVIGYLLTGLGAASWAFVRGGCLASIAVRILAMLKTKVW